MKTSSTPPITHSSSRATKATSGFSTSALTRAANLLEVVTVVDQDDDEPVIHAMPMQDKYKPLVRGLGEPDE